MKDSSEKSRLPSIAILGAGSMGRAILTGLSAAGVEVVGGIRVTTRGKSSADELSRTGVAAQAVEADAEANRSAVAGAAVVILAVKPVAVTALATEIGPALAPEAIVVSVAAGVRTGAIERCLPDATAVVRAMPNTPATIGRGVTGVAAGSNVSIEQLAVVKAVFATVGVVHEVPEEKIDALTAISGSGPAYVFLFAEKLAEAALELGLEPSIAQSLAVETVRGAADYLADSGFEPAELRRRVTSPRGTTERAIGVLEAERFGQAINAATAAARTRATELADELDEPTKAKP